MGSEGLTEPSEILRDALREHAAGARWHSSDCAYCVLSAALAAQRAAGEGLDVERLAKAICATLGPVVDGTDVFVDDECRARATEVATEYARLRAAFQPASEGAPEHG